jgi:hypothetical protein
MRTVNQINSLEVVDYIYSPIPVVPALTDLFSNAPCADRLSQGLGSMTFFDPDRKVCP